MDNLLCIVCPVIVHDQANIQILGRIFANGPEKFQKLATSVPSVNFADQLPGSDIQCSEQRRRSIAHVVMRSSLSYSWCERQYRLSSIQSLNLTFLVNTKNHCFHRRFHVYAYDAAGLFNEKRIGRQLKCFLSMWLRSKDLQNSLDGLFCDKPTSAARLLVLQ